MKSKKSGGNKGNSTDALAEEVYLLLIERLKAAHAGTGGPVDRLRRIVDAYIDFAMEQQSSYRLMLQHNFHYEDMEANLDQ